MSYQDCDPQTASELTQTNGVGDKGRPMRNYLATGIACVCVFALCVIGIKIYSQSVTPAFTQDDQIRFLKAQTAYMTAQPAIAEWEAVQRMALDRCGKEFKPEINASDKLLHCVPQSANAANPQAPSTPEKSANTKQK